MIVRYAALDGQWYDARLNATEPCGFAELTIFLLDEPVLDLAGVPRDDARAERGTWSPFLDGEKRRGESDKK